LLVALLSTSAVVVQGQSLASFSGANPIVTVSKSANQGNDQSDIIINTSLKDLINRIQTEYNVSIGFEEDVIKNKIVKTYEFKSTRGNVEEILNEIVEPFNLTVQRLQGNYFIISPRKQEWKSLEKKSLNEERQQENIDLRQYAAYGPYFQTKVIEDIPVSGTVTDDSGQGLPGVSVVVKGTTIGTVTDQNGKYTLSVGDESAILVFSFIGFVTEEIPVGNRTTLDVRLSQDIASLSEVVVVGYGTQKRSDITGSVASVPKDRLSNLPVANLTQAIQGTTAGLQITQGSSAPGSAGTMQIRGVNSINAVTNPFIVLDGVPFFGGINDINPNDIASIEVLKDASAVAIYGTRGSNGVILITTKRGATEAKPTISYSGYIGAEDIPNKLELMGPEAYVQKYADFLKANNQTQTTVLPNAAEVQNYNNGVTTDWMKEATRTGQIQEHNLSVSGGTSNVQYYVSGSHLNQKGVVKGYQFHRTSVRSNIDAKLTNYLKVGVSGFFTDNNYDGGRVNFLYATSMSPYSVPTDDNGKYVIYPMAPEQLFANPLLGLTTTRTERVKNLTGNGYAELTPNFLKGLKFRVNVGYIYTFDRLGTYTGRAANDLSGTAYLRNRESNSWVIENILSYSKDIEKHHIDVTALYSAQKSDSMRYSSQSKTFINDALGYYNLGAGASQSAVSSGSRYTLLSQMARVNYSFDSRYLLTLTARRDGYSAFGSSADKYGLFPSMAIGWNIHNERFLSGIDQISQLKLRGSYGQTGNMTISPNLTASTAGTVQQPFNGSVQTGILYNALGNSGLTWEKTTSGNIALDFGIFRNRISGTAEVYKSKTEDILLKRNLPTTTGYTEIWTNLGKMQNVGFEFTLNTVNLDRGGFKWETNLNFSTYKNKLLELYGDGRDDIGNKWFIGQPLRVIYGYEKIGIWQEGEDTSYDPVAKPGDIKFKDQITEDTNGDGVADAPDGKISEKDRVVIGQTDPKWFGGITNTFHYKNFHLSIFIQTSQGGIKTNQDLSYADEAGRRNLPADFRYWTPENRDNYWPSLSAYKNYRGYNFAEDWSYVRIKDVRLSYNVNKSFLQKYGMSSLTVYVAGRNLHTFTKWFGWDPEMRYYPRGSSDANGSWVDNYPITRSFTLGLNISL
jgi:TonB-linked SusC/RagA family outer membrane protein